MTSFGAAGVRSCSAHQVCSDGGSLNNAETTIAAGALCEAAHVRLFASTRMLQVRAASTSANAPLVSPTAPGCSQAAATDSRPLRWSRPHRFEVHASGVRCLIRPRALYALRFPCQQVHSVWRYRMSFAFFRPWTWAALNPQPLPPDPPPDMQRSFFYVRW
jgi:hypothetical protein